MHKKPAAAAYFFSAFVLTYQFSFEGKATIPPFFFGLVRQDSRESISSTTFRLSNFVLLISRFDYIR